jgi:hypothetical protein
VVGAKNVKAITNAGGNCFPDTSRPLQSICDPRESVVCGEDVRFVSLSRGRCESQHGHARLSGCARIWQRHFKTVTTMRPRASACQFALETYKSDSQRVEKALGARNRCEALQEKRSNFQTTTTTLEEAIPARGAAERSEASGELRRAALPGHTEQAVGDGGSESLTTSTASRSSWSP